MASVEVPVNGTYGGPALPQSTSPAPPKTQDVPKDEVAWYFVERYYNTLSRSPKSLYLFFNKRSQYVVGVEEEKVPVSIGQSAIQQRIKELDFQDCKVRVTNVDSQTSDSNIVIQVIGEMSNKAATGRKFVQTFVLATQTNGYFVLNDIFRYIADEEDDYEQAQEDSQAETAPVHTGYREPAPTSEARDISDPAATKETVTKPEEVKKVNEKLEEAIEEESVEPVNGTSAAEEIKEEEVPAAVEEKVEPKKAAAEEPEKTKEQPAPAEPESKPAPKAATPSAPPKPAVPKTWAQLASSGTAAKAAAAAAAAASASASTPAASAPASTTPKPALTPTTAAPPAAAASGSSPARQPSPADSAQEGSSSGGWQTAGADHNRKQSRAGPAVTENGRVRAYVKNVYQNVDADELKAALAKFGEIPYFDVSRQKNSAFVEFATVAAFNAAVAANPHRVGNENIYVEERRPAGGFTRGGARGGRGGANFDRSGSNPGRGGFSGGKQGEAPRGGARGGRGGTGNANQRGRTQAA